MEDRSDSKIVCPHCGTGSQTNPRYEYAKAQSYAICHTCRISFPVIRNSSGGWVAGRS